MAAAQRVSPTLLSRIAEAITAIRYGTIHSTIHDSRVVQIEQTEKIRLSQDADLASGADSSNPPIDRTTGAPRLPHGRE
jgi:hypothetical protein